MRRRIPVQVPYAEMAFPFYQNLSCNVRGTACPYALEDIFTIFSRFGYILAFALLQTILGYLSQPSSLHNCISPSISAVYSFFVYHDGRGLGCHFDASRHLWLFPSWHLLHRLATGFSTDFFPHGGFLLVHQRWLPLPKYNWGYRR